MPQMAIFVPYFGGKYMRAPKYPVPLHNTIIEPFAGFAGYSVRHHERKVILIDASEKVCGVWQYLIGASPAEILALPLLQPGEDIHALSIPQEAKWLLGFWANPGSATPKRSLARISNARAGCWGEYIRARLAAQVPHIRHWQIYHGDYTSAPDVCATWYIDPPYQKQGKQYPHRITDYVALAAWCQARPGQVMVCESEGADWLPFTPVTQVDGASHRRTTEVLWTGGI